MAGTSNIRSQIKGRSKSLVHALNRLERAARGPDTSVLIRGETGTGKELAARLVHHCSGRKGELVAFNCAAIPKDLMESELFGHVRGAFSGAVHEHTGLFERADGGTLFLDEIGDMPVEMQAKVLRAIEEGEVRRVGSTQVRKVTVGIVCATHCDLSAMVKNRTFREDLLYRINGYVVGLPPLRKRDRDVVQLARLFLRDAFPTKRISGEAEAMLLTYKWPGNVRELQNVIRAAGIDAGRTIRPEHLAQHLDHTLETSAPSVSRTDHVLAVVDRIGSPALVEIGDETSLPRTTLRRALGAMVAAGALRRIGDGRHTRYARAIEEKGDELAARHKLIMRHAQEAGRITRHECADTTGASIRTASRDLSQLVELGYLVADGRGGNAVGYVLARRNADAPNCADRPASFEATS